MVLYCIQHSAYILRAIVHKFKYHPQEEAVLVVDKDISSPYCPQIDKIKYYRMPDPFEIARCTAHSQKELKRLVNKKISDFFQETEINPWKSSHVYVLFDMYNPFILYFEAHSIKYISVECADSSFNRCSTAAFIKERPESERAYNQLILDMHLQDAQGKNCIKAYINSDHTSYIGKTPSEIYDFYKELHRLDEEHKRLIIKAYDIDRYKFDAILCFNSPMYTNGSIANMGAHISPVYTRDDRYGAVYHFYKTMIDYYYSDIDFILKLHPESDEKFEEAFSEFKQLPRHIPSETLLLLEKKFDVLCPIKTGGINIFQDNGYNVSFFDLPVVSFFDKLPFVCLSFALIGLIAIPGKIAVHRINWLQMDHFKRFGYKDFKDVEFEKLDMRSVKNSVFIMAEPLEDLTELIRYAPQDCLILVNGDYEPEPAFSSQKMTYTLTDVSGSEEEELQRHSWTLLSKNKALVDVVKDFAASYTLEHSGVRVDSCPS